MIKSSYLHKALNVKKRSVVIDKIVKKLINENKSYAIACCGMSGMLIGPEVANRLKWPVWIVRKAKEKSHSYLSVEGDISVKDYIIIDDFIDTGETIKYINRKISDCIRGSNINQIILYEHHASIGYWKKEFNCKIIKV